MTEQEKDKLVDDIMDVMDRRVDNLNYPSIQADIEKVVNNIDNSESQTIKTVNPSAYWFNAELIGFENMKGRTVSELDTVTPLYTMQLTDKVACEVCNDTEDLKTICSDCITNECNDRI